MNDLQNFAGYCEAWAFSIEAHHNSEVRKIFLILVPSDKFKFKEEVVFPFLNTKMDFSGEAEAHKVIHAALDEITTFVKEVKADISTFNPDTLREKMKKIRDPLFNHLDEEVEHIAGPNLKEAGFTEAELTKLIAELMTYAKNHGNPFLVLPFMNSHIDPKFRSVWPAFPWVLSKVIVPWVMAMRYSGYWKYSPYPV